MRNLLHSFPIKILLIAFIGTLLCVIINEINSDAIHQDIPNQYGMVQTADETSYIVPPKNWINHGKWKDNSNGLTSYYQRSPGYGIIYAFNYLVLGKNALFGLKIMQILLFFASILLFWRILKEFHVLDKLAFIATTLFAFLPMYSGFVYYSLTEGVTPFFVLWSFLELKKATDSKKFRWQLVVSIALLVLIRPQLGILPFVGCIYGLITKNRQLSSALIMAIAPLFLWYVRTAVISQETPSLHPIYSKTNNHFYRPSHAAVTELFRVWEWRSDVFHSHTGKVGFGNDQSIVEVLNEIPQKYHAAIQPILVDFQSLNQLRLNECEGQKIDDYLPGELQFIHAADSTRKVLIQENKWDYYLRTPLLSAKEFLNKSYMNLFVFQAAWRGNWFIEALRVICWLMVVTTMGVTFLSAFVFKLKSLESFIVIALGVFMFYLVFVQRLNEERYIVPILPLFFILAVIGFSQFRTKKNASQQ